MAAYSDYRPLYFVSPGETGVMGKQVFFVQFKGDFFIFKSGLKIKADREQFYLILGNFCRKYSRVFLFIT